MATHYEKSWFGAIYLFTFSNQLNLILDKNRAQKTNPMELVICRGEAALLLGVRVITLFITIVGAHLVIVKIHVGGEDFVTWSTPNFFLREKSWTIKFPYGSWLTERQMMMKGCRITSSANVFRFHAPILRFGFSRIPRGTGHVARRPCLFTPWKVNGWEPKSHLFLKRKIILLRLHFWGSSL